MKDRRINKTEKNQPKKKTKNQINEIGFREKYKSMLCRENTII